MNLTYLILSLFVLMAYKKGSACSPMNSWYSGCWIQLDQDFKGQTEPLILKSESNDIVYPKFISYSHQNVIFLRSGENLRVHCGESNFEKITEPNNGTITIVCRGANRFRIVDESVTKFETYRPADFACKSIVKSEIKEDGSCGLMKKDKVHKFYQIGFTVSGDFLPVIHSCFNTELRSVLWSKHLLTSALQEQKAGVEKIKVIQDFNPYNASEFDIEVLYDRKHQAETVAKIINSTKLAEKYIHVDGRSSAFFSRGHLVPKSDFIYSAEMLATFNFINAAPLWQQFNGGKWENVESTIRNRIIELKKHIGRRSNDFTTNILTLTLGNAQFVDEGGNEKDIYLYVDEDTDEKYVKVPKLYAKVVVFQDTRLEAVVLVGTNNPYGEHIEIGFDEVICPNVCHNYSWLRGINDSKDQYGSGEIYCCTVTDFIRYLRSNDVKNLGSSLDEMDNFVEGFETVESNAKTFVGNLYSVINK